LSRYALFICAYTAKIKDLSVIKYKIILWKVIKDILEIAAYDIAGCEEEIILDHIST
jgi:hypothetical protein